MKTRIKKNHFQVTAGLIWCNGRILIARRPKGTHLEGYWEFPGGKQEQGETLRECLQREIEEELGMRVKVEKRVSSVEHEYDDRIISLHFFVCTHTEGDPVPREGQNLRWVQPEDLERYTFPPADEKFLKILQNSWHELSFMSKNP